MEYGRGSGPSVWGRIPAEQDRCGVVFPRFGAPDRPFPADPGGWDDPAFRAYSHEAAQECAEEIVTESLWSWHLSAEKLLNPEFWPGPDYLAPAFEAALVRDVGRLVRGGWTPADLAVAVHRTNADPACVAVLATALHLEAAARADVWMPPGWTAAIHRLGRRAEVNGRSIPGLRAIMDVRRSFQGLTGLADSTDGLDWLTRRSEDAELAAARALLDRAECADTDVDAQALTGQVQSALRRRSVGRLNGAEPPPLHLRRIWLSQGYVKPQEAVLTSLAEANRCGVVFTRALTLATLIGPPWDLDTVEMLNESLLVQAAAGRRRRAEQFRDARRPGSTVPLPAGPPFMTGFPARVHDLVVAAARAAERDVPAGVLEAVADDVRKRLALLPRQGTLRLPDEPGPWDSFGEPGWPVGPYRPGCA